MAQRVAQKTKIKLKNKKKKIITWCRQFKCLFMQILQMQWKWSNEDPSARENENYKKTTTVFDYHFVIAATVQCSTVHKM